MLYFNHEVDVYMGNTVPRSLSVLLLDDDIEVQQDFENCLKDRNDVYLVATTASCFEAIKLIEKHKPDAVIVDIELPRGIGTGFEFLIDLKKLKLDPKPYVVVNTQVASSMLEKSIRRGHADFYSWKYQQGYRAEYVINAIVFNCEHTDSNISFKESDITKTSLNDDESKYIDELINKELNAIGIAFKFRGRKYIFQAIKYLLIADPNRVKSLSALQYVAKLNDKYPSGINRDIQTAINRAWEHTDTDTLLENYTIEFSVHTGVPTTNEFIQYYYNRIKEQI